MSKYDNCLERLKQNLQTGRGYSIHEICASLDWSTNYARDILKILIIKGKIQRFSGRNKIARYVILEDQEKNEVKNNDAPL